MKVFEGINLSVIGNSHTKASKVCEDFSLSFTSDKIGIAIACDGHGSEKHFRSSTGSKIAAEVSFNAIFELMKHEDNFSKNKKEILIQLEKSIIYAWNIAVNEDYRNNPFIEEELSNLNKRDREYVESDFEIAYGSTLIAVAFTNKYCFGIQIGDGDCVLINHMGEITNPMPWDERLQFNITTSLCDKAALSNFRHFWIDAPINAIMVTTDGVRNSFSNEKYYHDFFLTLLGSLTDTSFDEAKIELMEFLQRLTIDGSGDDVSVSVVYDKAKLTKLFRQTEKESSSNDSSDNSVIISYDLNMKSDESNQLALGSNQDVLEGTNGQEGPIT